jgi:hypothetical protein
MIELTNGTFNANKREIECRIKIVCSDGDETAIKLYEILMGLMEEATNGPALVVTLR